jgi:ribonuclease P protein component
MRRADFLRVSQLGRRLNARYFLILILDRGATEGGGAPDVGAESPRLGITVTRRVGKAVRRNRIKRLVREWFRGSQERLRRDWQGHDLVVIAKREIPETLGLADVQTDLDRALGGRPSQRASQDAL